MTYVLEFETSAVSELIMTLEKMVTTVDASVELIFATFISSFTFITTFDTCRETKRRRSRRRRRRRRVHFLCSPM